jgi:site-specific DNA-methyltransferase (adenine-specific)
MPPQTRPTIDVRIGQSLEKLRELDDQSVHCVVTSPPYWCQRNYAEAGQLGLEQTPTLFVEALVEIFNEVHRVLRDDGTCWLNLGDTYAGYWGDAKAVKENRPSAAESNGWAAGFENLMNTRPKFHDAFDELSIKSKDVVGIPWMVAFALRDAGWYLRQEIIWAKPDPTPESVKDRCTRAHETIFLLTKKPRYYFDVDVIKEPSLWGDGSKGKNAPRGSFNTKGTPRRDGEGFRAITDTRRKRSVWTVATSRYRGAHFAMFPPDLIEPCILAGCPKDGIVLDPFAGSGTTAGVAAVHGRSSILLELSETYAKDLIEDRINWILERAKVPEDKRPILSFLCNNDTPEHQSV